MPFAFIKIDTRFKQFGEGAPAPEKYATKAGLHAYACKATRDSWGDLALGEMGTPWCMAWSPVQQRCYLFEMEWQDDDDKLSHFIVLSKTLKEQGCSHYTLVSETRIKSQDKETGKISIEYEDAVSVLSSDTEGKALMTSFYKDADGVHDTPESYNFTETSSPVMSGTMTEFLLPGTFLGGEYEVLEIPVKEFDGTGS